ncbi:Dam family site-specific DNA-(adenine-N6)-methyltransferase [Gilliamella sp. N-G2]|uniref:DNA adenine methylase n=1 Tax=Gilliamella sp. N-G2 TaxID=1970471 RepID=UPI0013023636|nr:Dam family site-specific DNA-(adenine-N6)-methyltransferase [Gilliamella sp. N-G2]
MCIEKSFLKWVGSKNRLIPQLLPHLPSGKRFIEPFVGAGNVFINTNYASYVLCDKNSDLINVYKWLRDDLARLLNETKSLFDSQPDFYDVRSRFNNSTLLLSVQRAAEFIYLNRHCFNGVCRYNAKGEFNVPIGNHKSIYFPKTELIAFSNKLISAPVELVRADFSAVIENAKIGDVIYCDPPYISGTKDDIFTGYTPCKFDTETTKCLHDLLVLAVRRGATAIISNSNNSLIREIFNDFEIYEIDARRSVAANGNRKPAREIIGVLMPEMIN